MPKISEYAELVTPTDDDLLVTVSAGITKKVKRANFLGKTLNYIGIAGSAGFGVGICPNTLPAGMLALPGYDVIGNDQYGNYQYSDGSIMVWIPKFYYKVLHDGTTNINKVLIASVYDYENETAANTAGYALHRAFIDGGAIKDGFFIDKYKWSLTNFVLSTSGIASSVINGNPIAADAALRRDRAITITNATASGAEVTITATSHGLTQGTPSAMTLVISGVVGMTDLNGTKTVIRITDANTIVVSLTTAQTYTSGGTATTTNFPGSFSDCKSNSQTPTDNYGGAWAAAKSRGSNFAVWSMFIHSAISLLSLAHGQAAVSTTNCAWYLTNKNYPKGNNNYGADIDDATCTFTTCDGGYWASRNEARKNGSGTLFAKTTHNGQNCGVSDLQGDQWQIAQGLTCIATSTAITSITRANPSVFTKTTHGYTTGDILFVDGSMANSTPLTSGTLEVGKSYTITTRLGSDDFTNVGAAANTNGTIFIATGTTPTTWTSSSIITPKTWNSLLQYVFFTVDVIDVDTYKLKYRSSTATDGTYLDASIINYDYTSGFTTVKGTFYILKESATLKNVTGGSGAATDHFNNATIFDAVDFSSFLANSYTSDRFGNGTNQTLPFNTSRSNTDYKLSSLAMPKDKNGISGAGSNTFGADYFYKFIRNELCPLAGGYWSSSPSAGVWGGLLSRYRADSASYVSARACLYV